MHGYSIVEKMAAGSCGVVFKVRRHTDGATLVMKRIALHERTAAQRLEAAQELLLMRELQHPHIVALRDAFLYNGNDLCIIMDYYDGGDLDGVLAAQRDADAYVSLRQVMLWFTQMLLAVHHLHAHGVVHRDLKAHNVFIDRHTRAIAIGDLGIAERVDAEAAAQTTATTTTHTTRSGDGGTVTSTAHDDGGDTDRSSAQQQQQTQTTSLLLTSARTRRQRTATATTMMTSSTTTTDAANAAAAAAAVAAVQDKMMKGTPLYMAPELLLVADAHNNDDNNDNNNKNDSDDSRRRCRERADVWSLGCILYEMLALRHPFESRELGGLLLRVTRAAYAPLPRHYPRALHRLVARMLCVDAARRPSCAALLRTPCVHAYLTLYAQLCRVVVTTTTMTSCNAATLSPTSSTGDATSATRDAHSSSSDGGSTSERGDTTASTHVATLALDLTVAQRNMHAQMRSLLLQQQQNKSNDSIDRHEHDDDDAVASADALEAALGVVDALPSAERAAAEREMAATAATSRTLLETALLSHAPSTLSSSSQQPQQQQQPSSSSWSSSHATHDAALGAVAASAVVASTTTTPTTPPLRLSLPSELPASSMCAMLPTESMRPFMIYDRTTLPMTTPPLPPLSFAAAVAVAAPQSLPPLHTSSSSYGIVHDGNDDDDVDTRIAAASSPSAHDANDNDDDNDDDIVADMRAAPLDVLAREVRRMRGVVQALMRQHIQQEQQQQQRAAAHVTLPSDAALRRLVATCGDAARARRLRACVEQRAALLRDVRAHLPHDACAAVYAYYATRNVLERQPRDVAALVPCRAHWTLLPTLADVVALDAFVREHVRAAAASATGDGDDVTM